MEGLKQLGGGEGLAKALGSHHQTGLDAEASGPAGVESHRQVYGENKHKEVPPKGFFAIVYENLQDPIILLLIAAATVSHEPAHSMYRLGAELRLPYPH